MNNKMYLCIDLKSFYASVECIKRGLDPMTTNLVVADESKTEKTICLAVSPSLKSLGISGRARLFEVIQKVRDENLIRKKASPNHKFIGKSSDYINLKNNPELELDYIVASPKMSHYMEYSTRIYDIYLKYIAPEDIHVYSIDEVFMDITSYLDTYKLTANELAVKILNDVLESTGITATVGIGTNMYLAKIAMDVMAKRMPADKNGVRLAFLDELTYRKELWTHRPLTDFWRVGKATAQKLEKCGIYTMGDIAAQSLNKYGEEKLYNLFGINAELLIDHAWGFEPCEIKDIRDYVPDNKSISSGQVLSCPYNFESTKLIVKEMIELLALDLVEKHLATDQIVLTIGYDVENLTSKTIFYKGEVTKDAYGRKVPKHAHGTANIGKHTASTMTIMEKVMELYDKIVDKNLLIRRINISANHIIPEHKVKPSNNFLQLDLFTDYEDTKRIESQKELNLKKERAIQEATINLRNKFGKNAVLKGMNLQKGATTKERNKQIGGHKA